MHVQIKIVNAYIMMQASHSGSVSMSFWICTKSQNISELDLHDKPHPSECISAGIISILGFEMNEVAIHYPEYAC